jgi:hypothetical protein
MPNVEVVNEFVQGSRLQVGLGCLSNGIFFEIYREKVLEHERKTSDIDCLNGLDFCC